MHPLLLCGMILALMIAVAVTAMSPRDGDDWAWLGYVRRFLDEDSITNQDPFMRTEYTQERATFSGWFVLQAGLARCSGVDAVDVVRVYLPPLLAILSLFAFYSLAKELFRRSDYAAHTILLQVLVLLAWESPSGAFS